MNLVRRRTARAFTLLELLITIVILGVILAVSMPSIQRYLESQRLRSVNGELTNDLQFARAEAVARQQIVGLRFERDGSRTCYTVAAYTGLNCLAGADARMASCDCRLGPGAACTGNWAELRTVNIPISNGVRIDFPGPDVPTARKNVAFDPTSGQISYCNPNMIGVALQPFAVSTTGAGAAITTEVAAAGRAKSCVASGKVAGMPTC